MYTWIESFLTGRLQAVVVDGVKSAFEEVKSGVPQGTVLGPAFFILYVIDMVLTVKNSKSLTFADDTKLIKVITYLLCKALLEADLYNITEWSIANKEITCSFTRTSLFFCCHELLPQHIESAAELTIHGRDKAVLYL